MSLKIDYDEESILKELSKLSKLGPIVSVNTGSNAVGKLLQESLNISHSTSKRNSFHNYTISATTSKLNSTGRTNLFACVPNWQSSPFKSSKEIVESFGRENLSRGYSKCLFCSVTSQGPNGFGLVLRIDRHKPSIEEWYVSEKEQYLVASWSISKLMYKLGLLNKTAIITALPIEIRDKKAFHYRYVDLLKNPDFINFIDLIENGSITMDHCISIKTDKNSAREQGPLFKIRSNAREDLYQNIKRIDLMDL